jgi:tetratricopeptide (TPR) repeat protein
MDRRKLLWLGGAVLAAATGCTRHETVNSDSYSSPSVQSAARQSDRRKQPDQPVAKEADLKPATLIGFADVQSQTALNGQLPDDQRRQAYDLAQRNYKRAIQVDPKNMLAVGGLARLYSCNGDHDQALTLLDGALQKAPESASLWFERGMVMGRLKRFDEALANVRHAYQLDPGSGQYSKSVGLMLARMGQSEDAVTWLRKSMSESDARYNVGQMMRHIGQEAEARRQFQLSLTVDPAHQQTLAALGMAPPAPAPASPSTTFDPSRPAMAKVVPALQVTIDKPAIPDALPQRPEASQPTPLRRPVQIGFEPN